MGNLLGNPYILLISFVFGFALCWPIGTWRVDAAVLANAKKDIQAQADAEAQRQKDLDNYLAEEKKNLESAKEIVENQRKLNDDYAKSQVDLQVKIVGIQNAARNLQPLNCKLDDGHMQLLDDITKAANSGEAITAPTKNAIAPRNSKLHTTLPKSANK